MTSLADQHCAPCNADTPVLDEDATRTHLAALSDRWEIDDTGRLVARIKFKNYYRIQAFVNAVAYIAHRESHHPEITFGYNTCRIELITHAIEGLSENDFISAAKIDALLD
ncbi:pterin-4-alpha-carbinolamine dehydratase [Salinisphaera dokdonensis CL-ES53]|uniref:4a-hydroxytetrahydrobiopterin dehydratase n=1 Tax=Salinisphaera dokdonensis CL-ES53 TaxID=1304272 RepID=A0ABV2AVW5_9GAMM